MHDQPSAAELVAAVKAFLRDTARPQLTGHAAFHARVAENALAIVERELASRPGQETEEARRLADLLGESGSSDALNRKLARAIADGHMTIDTPGLLDHLKKTAIAQVEVDQPNYSGLGIATKSVQS
jgi:hypothetical protein